MTLLSICQDAAQEIGFDKPTYIFGNTSLEVIKLLRYAQKVGKRCMKVVKWQQLTKENTFSALAQETQTGILPSDFDRFIPDTMYNRTNKTEIKQVKPIEWQQYKAIDYNDTLKRKFLYIGNAIMVTPNLEAGDIIAFNYINKNFVLSSLAAEQDSFAADTDTSVIDEELIKLGVIYEYLQGDGLPYQVAMGTYEARLRLLIDNELPDIDILSAGDIFETSSFNFTNGV